MIRNGGLVLLVLFAALVGVGVGWRATVASPSPELVAAPVAEVRARVSDPSTARFLELRAGQRAAEVAAALDRSGLGDGGRFLEVVERRRLEGYLVPGVYELEQGKTEEELVDEMSARFDEQFTPAMRAQAKAVGLSLNEAVTLASIVEREVAMYSEAPVVAGVFINRLRRGIALKADPTIIYAVESRDRLQHYWRTPLRPFLQLDSSYNTYRYKGLPPRPIASPSKQALLAAVYPARVPHLFFVARGTGAHDFSRTGREHVRKAARYRRAEKTAPPPGRPTELHQLVEKTMSQVEGHVGVVVQNLATGEFAAINPDEHFTAASLYKLVVMVTAFEQRERGRLSFRERLTIAPKTANEDYAALQARLGRHPTVRKAIQEMIVVSSNAAGVTLLRRFGYDEVNRVARAHGMTGTFFSRSRIVTTPRDIARLLELIARGRVVSRGASAEMTRILLRQEIRDRLPLYLPSGARLAHKTGTLDFPSHDAGILFVRRGPVVIAALTEDVRQRSLATESLALLGRLAYDYFETYQPLRARLGALTARTCPDSPFHASGEGPLSRRTIVLDPGYGGRSSGTVANGLAEKDVALDLALRLRRQLISRGATVAMTRCRDAFVSLLGRAAIANAAKADLVVSLRLGQSHDEAQDGISVGYAFPDGKVLARHLLGTFAQPALWEQLSERRSLPNLGDRKRRSSLLRYSLAAAADTASVYLTNPGEARALRGRARRAAIVRGHVRGILMHLGVPEKFRKPRRRAPARRAPPAGAEVSVAAVGDIALRTTFDGATTLFGGVREALAGDLVLGNLEGTLALGGRSKCARASRSCFAFRAPPWYAHSLRQAGFTVLNLANNHARDFGEQGMAETVAALDAAGLAHTGRPGQIARVESGRVRVGILGFSPSTGLLDLDGARRVVRAADTWADLVVVNMHAGAEGAGHAHVRPGVERYLGEARGDPVAFAHAVIEAGADLVIGHGPHVLRGLEWYRGRLVAYSLGNFAAQQTLSLRGPLGIGGVLRVTLRADGSWRGGTFVPVRLEGFGTPRTERTGGTLARVRSLSTADFGLRAVGLSRAGDLRPPLGP